MVAEWIFRFATSNTSGPYSKNAPTSTAIVPTAATISQIKFQVSTDDTDDHEYRALAFVNVCLLVTAIVLILMMLVRTISFLRK